MPKTAPEKPRCTVPGCDQPVIMLKPLPICERDALLVAVAYDQAVLREKSRPPGE